MDVPVCARLEGCPYLLPVDAGGLRLLPHWFIQRSAEKDNQLKSQAVAKEEWAERPAEENLGFCSNLDHVKWETKCTFLKIAGNNRHGFLLQCPRGQFTMPVTSFPLLLMLPFSNPRCLV